MRPALRLEARKIPVSLHTIAKSRTTDIVTHYGRNIRAMSIEDLAASCYLQGCEDMGQVAVKHMQPTEEPPSIDFQI